MSKKTTTPKPVARHRYRTREAWLVAAVAALAPRFKAIGHPLPKVHISVGWPSGSGLRSATIAECWHGAASADGVSQIFVSPVLGDAARVLDVVLHELVHAVNFAEGHNGHGKEFKAIAVGLGLEGKMTATVAGAELKADLEALVKTRLGKYPHAVMGSGLGGGAPKPGDPGPKGKPIPFPRAHPPQGTRMIKVACSESGYVARTTRKWLDLYGAPLCPCHQKVMEEG